MSKGKLGLIGLLCILVATPGLGQDSADHSCFARALPADIRNNRLDDVKLLIGWVFDAAATHALPVSGQAIDRHSGFANVPGFAGVTNLAGLKGRYRVMRAPFNLGHGYFGIEVGALEPGGVVSSLFLINRLFRLPILLHQPIGVATDLMTNGAMMTGLHTRAVSDANDAAVAALADAQRLKVPLVMAGQSQAGGVAQLQAATLMATHPQRSVSTGFITMNAAYVVPSIRRLKLSPKAVEGINFVSDLDPGFGPHGLLPNRIGLQIYIHPDGTGSGVPGSQSMFTAWRHAGQHLLSSFNAVSLTKALARVLDAPATRCVTSG